MMDGTNKEEWNQKLKAGKVIVSYLLLEDEL